MQSAVHELLSDVDLHFLLMPVLNTGVAIIKLGGSGLLMAKMFVKHGLM